MDKSEICPVLKVEGLRKSYQTSKEPFCAVSEVSFKIFPGECFGLLGPNGAGKSTSMNCITGFYPPSAGVVEILGSNVQLDPKRARSNLGMCSQDDTLDTDFSCLDQMVLYASYFGISSVEGESRAKALLKKLGLSDKEHEPVEALSGGMRRRLQVARALISNPTLLILDEPTTGLDPEARRVVWDIIQEFRTNRGSVLLSTHYMDEAERLCDRIAIMHCGVFLDCAPPQDLIKKHIGVDLVEEEIRPGVLWKRPPNLEDVYLKLAGRRLEGDFE